MELYEETLQAKYPASVMELDMMQDKKSGKKYPKIIILLPKQKKIKEA